MACFRVGLFWKKYPAFSWLHCDRRHLVSHVTVRDRTMACNVFSVPQSFKWRYKCPNEVRVSPKSFKWLSVDYGVSQVGYIVCLGLFVTLCNYVSSVTHCEIVVPCALNIALFESFKTSDLCFIDDIILGPHFLTHIPWAGTSLFNDRFHRKRHWYNTIG